MGKKKGNKTKSTGNQQSASQGTQPIPSSQVGRQGPSSDEPSQLPSNSGRQQEADTTKDTGSYQQKSRPPQQKGSRQQRQKGAHQQQSKVGEQSKGSQQQYGPPSQYWGPPTEGGSVQQLQSPQHHNIPPREGAVYQQPQGTQKFSGPPQQGVSVQQFQSPQHPSPAWQGGVYQQPQGTQKFSGPPQQGFSVQQLQSPRHPSPAGQGGVYQQPKGTQKFSGPPQQGVSVQQLQGPRHPSPAGQSGVYQQPKGTQKFSGPPQQGVSVQQLQSPQHPSPAGQGGVYQQPKATQKFSGPPQQGGVYQRPQDTQQSAPFQQRQDSSKQSKVPTQHKQTREDRGDENIVSKTVIAPGKEGRNILVESNHLALDLSKLGNLAYHYDVEIESLSKMKTIPKKFKHPIMELFRKECFPNRYPAYDGEKNLYSSRPLDSDLSKIFEKQIVIEDDSRSKTFNVVVKAASTPPIDMTVIKESLKESRTPREALQVLDIVLRMASLQNFSAVGKSFFRKPESLIDLTGGMEAYTGFYQSTVRGWQPFLNVDVAFKAFYKNTLVIDALLDLLQIRSCDLENLQHYQRDMANKYLRMLRVQYELPNCPGSRKSYRVNGLSETARNWTFTCKDQNITVQQYFASQKNYTLQYPNIPLLHVGDVNRADKILIPMELCTILPGQPLRGRTSDKQTSKMIRYAATSTDVRKRNITNNLQIVNYNKSPHVREFQITVDTKFHRLTARVLNPPQLRYADQRYASVSKGVWRNMNFLKPATIKSWTIVSAIGRYAPRPDDLTNMSKQLMSSAKNAGMIFERKATEPFIDIGSSIALIIKYFSDLKSKNSEYDIIFVVVPDNGPQYSFVKSTAEIKCGYLTQCIKQSTLRKMNAMTALNILLKVNSKLNGTNHILNQMPKIMCEPTIIMGADVTHPSPDSQNIPSVAAVTASHDQEAFQYNICIRLQDPKLEIIADMRAIVKEQLLYYYRKTRCKPVSILFFRDGVSEGQFEEVRIKEITAIRGACKDLQAQGYEPRITFLVVQKRHHTRFFPTDPRQSEDRNNNVPAGTCVDTDITHPFMQNFYLVSHASIQGVAKPTKYCVLHDDHNMSNDEIEKLSYYLCHMFTRCNRSVSYPAPTYYAHLAAARGKVYIENQNIDLSNLDRARPLYDIKDDIRKNRPMFFV